VRGCGARSCLSYKRFMSILNLIAAVPASSSAILSVGYLPLTFGVLDALTEKIACAFF